MRTTLLFLGMATAVISSADAQTDPLPPGALWRQGSTRLRHPGFVRALAFSPNGKLLASGGSDGAVRLWDPTDGRLLHVFFGNTYENRLYAVTFSPDGQTLAAGTGSGTYLWDVPSRKRKRHLEGEAFVVAFSPDGASVAGTGTALALWSTTAGTTLGRSPSDGRCIYGMTFSPDGKKVLYAHTEVYNKPGETDLLFWDIESMGQTLRLPGPKDWIHRLAFSSDGHLLAAAAHSEVVFWDAGNWQPKPGIKTDVSDLAFFPNSSRLAVASAKGVDIWDAKSAKKLKTLAQQQALASMAISPKGETLATGDRDGRLRLWDTTTGIERLPQPDNLDPLINIAFAPDGSTITSHSGDFVVRQWDAKTGRPLRVLATDENKFPHGRDFGRRMLAYSQDGRVLVGGGAEGGGGSIRVWDAAAGKERRRWPVNYESMGPLDLSPANDLLAMTSRADTVGLWNLANGKQVRQLKYSGKRGDHFRVAFSAPAFSPDGSLVAAAASPFQPFSGSIRLGPSLPVPRPTIELWEAATGRSLPAMRDAEFHGASHVLWFPGGTSLATLGGDGILIWNRASGQICRRLVLDKGCTPNCLALSRDGRWAAAGCVVVRPDDVTPDKEHLLCIWETTSGAVAWRRTGHQGDVGCLAFSPDGLSLASGSLDATLVMWDLMPPELQAARLPGTLSKQDLDRMWQDLAGTDAKTAYRIIWALAAKPEQAIPFLADKLQADPDAPIAQWVEELQAEKFAVRERAKKAFAGLGQEALPILRRLDERKLGLEGQRRVQLLLASLTQKPLSGQQLRQARAVAILERTGAPAARAILTRLAGGRATSLQTEHAEAALGRWQKQ